MGTDVNQVITTWNNACTAAKTELDALEAALAAEYNKYIDSLSAYLQKLKATNDIRQNYINAFSNEDSKNGTCTRNNFLHSAAAPIENIATKYILDNSTDIGLRNSYELVRAARTDVLLTKKVI